MIEKEYLGSILQIHLDKNSPENFVVGNLVWYDAKWFLLQSVSPYGSWDGLSLYLVSDIVAIETMSPYIERIKKLIPYCQENPTAPPNINEQPLETLLLFAQNGRKVIALELWLSGYRDVVGYVNSVNKSYICIDQIDEYGNSDGASYIFIDSITRCYFDDFETKCLELLSNL